MGPWLAPQEPQFLHGKVRQMFTFDVKTEDNVCEVKITMSSI